MIKIKNKAQLMSVENRTIKIARQILNDAIAAKKFTHGLIRKKYKIKAVATPKAFISRRIQTIK